MGNTKLQQARVRRNDEFYTQYGDIEAELVHYKKHFKGKVVYMNCDDPRYSNFWRYFKNNFSNLGLKKIISTYYVLDEVAYKTEYDGYQVTRTRLRQTGNFLSSESIITLKEVDIVVSNPPFSLFSSYVSQLMRFKKDFIILGSLNAVTYKKIFPYIMEGDVGMGVNYGTMEFIIPEDAPTMSGQRVDSEGIKYQLVGPIYWYTTLDVDKNYSRMYEDRYFGDMEYEVYDEYGAINVDRLVDIPGDYEGEMGVPITYMGVHNPEQFEIVGMLVSPRVNKYNLGNPIIKGDKRYARIVIKNKEEI